MFYDRTIQLKKYSRVEYVCKKDFPVVLHLKLHQDSQKVTSFITDQDHNHTNANANLLPTQTREKAFQLINTGVNRPKEIMRQINEAGLDQISTRQLYNLVI